MISAPPTSHQFSIGKHSPPIVFVFFLCLWNMLLSGIFITFYIYGNQGGHLFPSILSVGRVLITIAYGLTFYHFISKGFKYFKVLAIFMGFYAIHSLIFAGVVTYNLAQVGGCIDREKLFLSHISFIDVICSILTLIIVKQYFQNQSKATKSATEFVMDAHQRSTST